MSALTPGFGAAMSAGMTAGTTEQPETVVPLTALYPVARVDLMPPEIAGQRRFRHAQLVMVAVLLLTVAVAGVSFVVAMRNAGVAAEELAVEQQRTATLQAQAREYDEVPRVLTAIDRAQTALDVAMAGDVSWYPYLYQLSVSTPESVWFEKITFTSLAIGAPTTDPLAPFGSVATVTTSGRALAYPDVVAWVQEMDAVGTWDHALLADATADPTDGVLTFTTTARISAEAYTNRYSPEAAAATAPPVTTETDN